MENWVDIKDMNGSYQISNFGNVKSFITTRQNKKKEGKILKPYLNTKKYPTVCLFNKNYVVHRLVAEHFLTKVDGKNYVNHIDGNKQNNCSENLEWVTNQENIIHYFKLKKETKI